MSVGWNDIFDETTDWTAVEFLQMFWDAYAERVRILTGNLRKCEARSVPLQRGDPYYNTIHRNEVQFFSLAPASPYDRSLAYARPKAIVAGDYVARAVPHQQWFPYLSSSEFQYTGDPAEYSFCILLLQGLASGQNFFVDNALGLDWAVDDDATVWPVALDWPTLAARVGLDAKGFTRKMPAEFYPTSTRYNVYSGYGALVYNINANDNNPEIANGDKARCLTTTDDGFRAGEVYRRVNNTWVFVDPALEEAKPDTLTGYGFLEIGDYIGPWLWNEIRDCMNRLRWTTGWRYATEPEGMQFTQTYSESPLLGEKYCEDVILSNHFSTTYQDAKALVDAEWPTAVDSRPYMRNIAAWTYGERWRDEYSGEYQAHAYKYRAAATLCTTVSTHAPSRVSLFIDVGEPPWGYGMFVGHFNDFGDADIGPLGRHFVQAWDKGIGDPETVKKTLGNTTNDVPWPEVPLPGASGHGYEFKSFKWLTQWDVAGGLRYTAAT